MCSHYQGIQGRERFERHFGIGLPEDAGQADVWPGYRAMFIRNTPLGAAQAAGPLQALTGLFGLVPHWSTDLRITRSTYNARSETAMEKPSFRDAWRRGQHCIIPAEALFEPDWRSGRAVAARIGRADGAAPGGGPKENPAGITQLQGSSLQKPIRIGADAPHLRQRFGIGADQDVLTVIERDTFGIDASCPTAEGTRGFEHRDRNPALGEFDGGGHSGPAGTDDRHVWLGAAHDSGLLGADLGLLAFASGGM